MFILLLVVGSFGFVDSSSSCILNPFINNFEVYAPVENAIVTNPYYTQMGAELLMSIDQFKLMQHEFHVCAIATTSNGSEVVEVYHDCGRSVLGHTAVNGTEGWSDLSLSLYHNGTMLCSVTLPVFCCADASLIAQQDEIQLQETIADFLSAGKELNTAPIHRIEHVSASNHDVISVVIGIKSGALNLRKRAAIRATWMRELHSTDDQHQFRFVPHFLVGNSSLALANADILAVLQKEQAQYGDVLLAEALPVEDTYKTLGQKVLSFLASTFNNNQSAEVDYVLVMDDDVFVDVWQLKQFLTHLRGNNSTSARSFYGGEVLLNLAHHLCSH